MLSDFYEGWNEHLNDGLECLADSPRDCRVLLIPSRLGTNISMMDWSISLISLGM